MEAHEILDIPANAPEDEIRAAYLRKTKQYPPEKSPAEFEAVRDAYDAMRDPRRRARALLVGREGSLPFVSLLDGRAGRRVFAGPQPWREVLKIK